MLPKMFKTSSEYLPADVLEALRHTRVHTHMLKIPACRYFQYAQAHLCTLEACPKHLQADVLSTFSYFGVKLFAAYHMPTGIPKRLHADVLLFFWLSVWLLAICPGGRTGAICRQTCLATFLHGRGAPMTRRACAAMSARSAQRPIFS